MVLGGWGSASGTDDDAVALVFEAFAASTKAPRPPPSENKASATEAASDAFTGLIMDNIIEEARRARGMLAMVVAVA